MDALRGHEWRPGTGHQAQYVVPGHSPLVAEMVDRQADDLADLLNRTMQPAFRPLDDSERRLCQIIATAIADDAGWYERRVAAALAAATAPLYVRRSVDYAADIGSWPAAATKRRGSPVSRTETALAGLRRSVTDIEGQAKPVAVGFAGAAAAVAAVVPPLVQSAVLDLPDSSDDSRLVEVVALADRLADAIERAGYAAPGPRQALTAAAAAVVLVDCRARKRAA